MTALSIRQGRDIFQLRRPSSQRIHSLLSSQITFAHNESCGLAFCDTFEIIKQFKVRDGHRGAWRGFNQQRIGQNELGAIRNLRLCRFSEPYKISWAVSLLCTNNFFLYVWPAFDAIFHASFNDHWIPFEDILLTYRNRFRSVNRRCSPEYDIQRIKLANYSYFASKPKWVLLRTK